MKKLKLLTSLSAITALGGGVALTTTSCSKDKKATVESLAWEPNAPEVGVTSYLVGGVIKDGDKELNLELIKSISDNGSDSTLGVKKETEGEVAGLLSITPTSVGDKTFKFKFEIYKSDEKKDTETYKAEYKVKVTEDIGPRIMPTVGGEVTTTYQADATSPKTKGSWMLNMLASAQTATLSFELKNAPESATVTWKCFYDGSEVTGSTVTTGLTWDGTNAKLTANDQYTGENEVTVKAMNGTEELASLAITIYVSLPVTITPDASSIKYSCAPGTTATYPTTVFTPVSGEQKATWSGFGVNIYGNAVCAQINVNSNATLLDNPFWTVSSTKGSYTSFPITPSEHGQINTTVVDNQQVLQIISQSKPGTETGSCSWPFSPDQKIYLQVWDDAPESSGTLYGEYEITLKQLSD